MILCCYYKVEAVAYDNPIPGYGTRNTINLRLWAAKPSDQQDMVSPTITSNSDFNDKLLVMVVNKTTIYFFCFLLLLI